MNSEAHQLGLAFAATRSSCIHYGLAFVSWRDPATGSLRHSASRLGICKRAGTGHYCPKCHSPAKRAGTMCLSCMVIREELPAMHCCGWTAPGDCKNYQHA